MEGNLANRQRPIDELHFKLLEERNAIPLYQQIRIDLQNLMLNGQLMPGDILPSEMELAEAYRVSRQTVRQAISQLVTDQLLERKPGHGTTVLTGRNRIKFFLDQSFAQQMAEMGLKSTSEVLRIKQTVVDENAPASLHTKLGSPAMELIRLRYGDDIPIGVQYTTIVTDACLGLHEHDFTQESLYNLLITRYQMPISRIEHVVNAVTADPWHQNLLKIDTVSPLLLVKTTAFLVNKDPIEASTSYYRADKYEFSTHFDY
jgi:GntR family transcriptional regulator